MVLKQTPTCNFGEKAVAFSLADSDGKIWTLESCLGDKGLLVMFICNHCPYVKAIHKRLVRDMLALKAIGINSVAIMSNDSTDYPEDSTENMKKIAEQWQFPFPYLLDETQEIAKNYGAICTPDFFGYNKNLELQYRGRLDAGGKETPPPNSPRELFEAMREVAETGNGPQEQLPSIGCSIKWIT